MNPKFKKVWPILKNIARQKRRSKLVKHLLDHYATDEDFCSACRVIAKNLTNKNIIIKGSTATKLRKHKRTITALAKRNNKRQAALVRQSGGWLPIVVPLVASAIGEIISKVARR